MYDEFVRIWKEAFVISFRSLTRYVAGLKSRAV
jgi:hypothetical protein